MNSSKADAPDAASWGVDQLQLLTALGFGPDSVLMSEPKLFVDLPFLAALQRELMNELGSEDTERTLFHVGAIHGLRDAARIGSVTGPHSVTVCSPLPMRFGRQKTRDGALELAGTWPDQYEAEARLSKLGASERPSCALSSGYTSGWLSGTLGRDVVAVERSCRAAGAEECTFIVREEQAWADEAAGNPDETERPVSKHLPIASLRAVAGDVQNPAMTSPVNASQTTQVEVLPDQMDPDDPSVHIWGPVMVMPFTSPEVCLQTIEMLSTDDATGGVRVVVLDLGGEILDESFGAAAVESLVERVHTWGAEVILTGISPFSEEVIAELQANLLLSRKELPEAIAYAFQIAEAQRHLL